MAFNDDWGWFESKPQAGYANWLGIPNAPATMQESLGRRYNDFYNNYLGKLGQDPTLRWMDYLGGWNPKDYFRGLSAYDQGQTTFAPSYRFLGGGGW